MEHIHNIDGTFIQNFEMVEYQILFRCKDCKKSWIKVLDENELKDKFGIFNVVTR